MGIRIQKKLGYALLDFEYDKESWEATDPRVDLDLFNGEDRLYTLESEFSEWALSNPEEVETYVVEELGMDAIDAMLAREEMTERAEREGSTLFERSVTHAPEFGDPNVLLFQPLTYQNWSRYGNVIDSYEASVREERETRVDELTGYGGIYPYEGYMYRYPDVETPARFFKPESELTEEQIRRREGSDVGLAKGKILRRLYDILLDARMLEKEGVSEEQFQEFQEHLLEDWGCKIPTQILLFAHWSGIFTDSNTVYRLKPVLYTYWT